MLKSYYVLIVLLLSSIVFSSCDQKEVSSEINELDTITIDSLMSNYELDNGPGASLLITENGNIIYSKGYGLANLEESIPINTSTNFRLASITKQFTAMCIMILYSRGQLEYEQKLTDIFPNFPEYGNNITIRHLLHHTSGLKDYFSLIADTVLEQLNDQDVLNLMMAQTTTLFPPGTDYRYSNSGYALLALIVKNVSGKGFAEFLEEEIFFPLGMSNSIAFEDGISIVENRAYGYSQIDSEFTRDDQSITSAVLGDGVVGEAEGDALGDMLGDALGDNVAPGCEGDAVGDALGDVLGVGVVGDTLGDMLGDTLGDALGDALGTSVVGEPLGAALGNAVVGEALGDALGAALGDALHGIFVHTGYEL